MRIGLVLGAGGTTGAAFHAGTLLALQQDLGWDPRQADIVVGSSAGSIVGALLRAGLTTDDLAAWGAVAEPLESGRQARVLLDELEQAGYPLAPGRPTLSLPRAAMLANMLHPSRLRLHTAVMSLLPYGWIDAGRSLQRLGELVTGWPERPLWITAVRTADARRVVFGRDDLHHPVSLGSAVAASCAIPAVFRPVRIGAHRYIDGGAHSPTNADVLVGSGVDVAIILSPMSAQLGALRRRPDHVLRSLFARRLRIECAALRAAGMEVHVFEPDAATLATMGVNALDRKRSAAVVRESFLAAGSAIVGNDRLREILASASASASVSATV
jgi:NTE family protein